ncbi:MAG TPA: hypothetical protein VFI06_06525 [Chitinophagaceae bacterium]|nr:hypothetical protein [Chitinophagaceae bacterium]
MPIKSRADLNNSFTQGKRPKQQEFWDWQDSFYHKGEDTIKIGGWQSRSFLKDLRADGKPIASGGFSIIEIPVGVKKLKSIFVTGRGTGAPFTITTSLVYACDLPIPALNGAPSSGNPFPNNFFLYPIIGLGANPAASYVINAAAPVFGMGLPPFDITAIPKDVVMEFKQWRFLMLTITTSGSFGAADFVYCGLEYE